VSRISVADEFVAYFPFESTGKKFQMVRQGSVPMLGLSASNINVVDCKIGT
jgi:hypothetical protein